MGRSCPERIGAAVGVEKNADRKEWHGVDKAVKRIYQWLCTGRLSFLLRDQVKEDLLRLFPGELIGERLESFYLKKLKQSILVMVSGLLLGIGACCAASGGRYLKGENNLVRGNYQEGKRAVLLRTSALPGQLLNLTVYPTEIPEQDKESLAEDFWQEIDRYILGKNQDLQHVYRDLKLLSSYEGIPFDVEWESSRLDLLDEWGTVAIARETSEVILTATLRWGAYEKRIQFPITIIPVPKTKEEEQIEALEEYLLQTEQNTRTDTSMELPEQWQGEPVSWKQQTEDYSLLIWALTPAIAVILFLAADKDLHKELLERQQSLKAAYPGIVHRLILYLGAGLSLRKAFERLADTYENGEQDHPAGQELRLLARQLKAGIPESTVYEHFGRRLGVQEYMRLSALLLQNQRRGNAALLDRLRQEAEALTREKLLNARKLGEEAGTKLLFPMVLLLGCVMVMIMIPAFGVM